jgi:hypothetical protein
MSYCVNCGVELEKACKACPLCDTPVLNPREKAEPSEKLAYPNVLSIPKSTNNLYLAFVLSLIILIPTLVSTIINALLFNNPVIKYVVGGAALAWVWFLLPLMWKKPIPAALVTIDSVALLLYFQLFKISGHDTGWVDSFVVPVVIALWIIINAFILWIKKKKRSKSAIAASVLAAINVMTLICEIRASAFFMGKLQFVVSIVMTACCVSLMIFFLVLDKSKKMKIWLHKKFFI